LKVHQTHKQPLGQLELELASSTSGAQRVCVEKALLFSWLIEGFNSLEQLVEVLRGVRPVKL
jgi:hypothetical protein